MQYSFAEILLPVPLPIAFTYQIPETLSVTKGDYVKVPFGKRQAWGVVWECYEKNPYPQKKLKTISVKSALPPMKESMRNFIDWVADYTINPRGAVLKMAISAPKALEKEDSARQNNDEPPSPITYNVTLSESQSAAATVLSEKVRGAKFSTTLLEGVTGSGKTEVYCDAILTALNAGKQALILLPEIVLTTQSLERLEHRLGITPTPWHSHLTPAKRNKYWEEIALGKARVIIGARSALFLPFKSLGLIVVDEEHDASYKQEEGVIYHARDMAVVRARFEECPAVLASATPSLETIANTELHRYDHVELSARFGGAKMPQISLIDLRKESLPATRWISPTLAGAMQKTLERQQQSILFLNRRGYAPLTLCRSCGYRFACPDCATWLVEHKTRQILTCHQCGYHTHAPNHCPECKKEGTLVACGPGVERVAEEVRERFPNARVMELTSDSITSPKAAAAFMSAMENREIDIVVGTQIIAKGHHFPFLTLVGIIDADLGLAGGDLRAAERTFQLLHQVSGRAGRAEDAGHVFLQTVLPESTVMRALISGNRKHFFAYELKSRKEALMPPFGRLAALIISGAKEELVAQTARKLCKLFPAHDKTFSILGPVPAPLYKLRGQYRYRLLLKTPRAILPHALLRSVLEKITPPSSVRIKIDIDPYNFL